MSKNKLCLEVHTYRLHTLIALHLNLSCKQTCCVAGHTESINISNYFRALKYISQSCGIPQVFKRHLPSLHCTKPNPSSLQVLIPSPELSFSPPKAPSLDLRLSLPSASNYGMNITLNIFAPPAYLHYLGWWGSLVQAVGLPGGLS